MAGCDEVGRGCVAGPVVATCVILKTEFDSNQITDSKKIPKNKHKELVDLIIENSLEYHTIFIDSQTIDEINILNATKEAMKNSIEKFNTKIDLVLTDFVKIDSNINQENITKGDSKSLSIAAASLIAKYTRDSFMKEISKDFPVYNFSQNSGYLTKEHKEALKKFGFCSIHRKSFEPIKSMHNKIKIFK
ncbi:ribonuclease HII [Mycoplasma sp. Z386]